MFSCWCYYVMGLLCFLSCFSDTDVEMEAELLGATSPEVAPKSPPKPDKKNRMCTFCRRFLARRDPHDLCYRCRVPCLEARCQSCEGLSEVQYSAYKAYILAQTAPQPVPSGTPRTYAEVAATSVAAPSAVPSAVPAPTPALGVDAIQRMIQAAVEQQLSAIQYAPATPLDSVTGPGSVAGSEGSTAASVQVEEPAPALTALSVVERVAMVSDILGIVRPTPVLSGPKPAVGQSATLSKSQERSFPLSELVEPLRKELNAAFKAAPLRGSPMGPPAWRQESFPISDGALPLPSPIAEPHTELLGIQSPPAASVSQATLQTWDTTARHCLHALSHADTYSAAASVLLDPSSSKDQKLYQCLYGIGESLAYLTGAMGFFTSQAIHLRRLAYLDLARLDTSCREELARQPWSSTPLFNGKIPAVIKQRDDSEQRLATRRCLELFGSLAKGKPREYYASRASHTPGRSGEKGPKGPKRTFPSAGGSGTPSHGAQHAKVPKTGKPKSSKSKGHKA